MAGILQCVDCPVIEEGVIPELCICSRDAECVCVDSDEAFVMYKLHLADGEANIYDFEVLWRSNEELCAGFVPGVYTIDGERVYIGPPPPDERTPQERIDNIFDVLARLEGRGHVERIGLDSWKLA